MEDRKMHRTRALTILGFVLVGIVVVTIFSFSAKPATAGKPSGSILVGCRGEDEGSAGSSIFLECNTSDGTLFTENQRVPEGYFLLVTDVTVTRYSGTESRILMKLFDAYDISSRGDWLPIGSEDRMVSAHFTTPYLIIPAGHRLEVEYGATKAEYFGLRVSGLLVNDVSSWP
jgi:hypothetical protein